MQMCFAGTQDCGKTTLSTLLHLRSTELLRQRRIGYGIEAVKGGLDLNTFADTLKNGSRVPANPPKDGIQQSIMRFSFKSWKLFKRHVSIYAHDSGGGLQKTLFDLIPPNFQWDDQAFNEIQALTSGITRDKFDQFVNTVFNADAYLFVIDGIKAREQIGNVVGDRQDRAFAQFVSNITNYKKLHPKDSPKLRGFGILLTKVDKIPELAGVGRVPDAKQIEEWVGNHLQLGAGALENLKWEYKVTPKYFYHMLHESNNSSGPVYEIDPKTGMIWYPKDQYDLLIYWCRKMVRRKLDYFGRLA